MAWRTMRHPKRRTWTLIGVLLTTLLASPLAAQPALARVPNPAVCSPGKGPTQWTDDLRPPTTIRVRRSYGPDKGHVQTVPFWNYVGVVVRAEYSGAWKKSPMWMRIGALTVKEYAWFRTMKWRGGKVTTDTANSDGTVTTTVECYDVKDTTADQIYKPVEVAPDGTVYKGNTPGPNVLQALRETWHMSLRKWKSAKNRTALFVTGYRTGKKVPCGTDARRNLMKQASLRDCADKNLTFEEVIRAYYDPIYIVDGRGSDSLADASWMGDLGVLRAATGSASQWRLYPGKADGFGSPSVGKLTSVDFSTVVDYGRGNVDAADPSGVDDAQLLADLLILTDNNKLLLARANGNGFDAPLTTNLVGAQPRRLLVADFNGDLLADVGLLRSTGTGTASLSVMLSQGDGTFGTQQAWWSGALDLAASSLFVAAGDVNGDGMADLIVRDAGGGYRTAISSPSCSNLKVLGACPSDAIGGPGLAALVPALASQPDWSVSGVKSVSGDYDRDGREDILAVVRLDTGGVKVMGMRSKGDGSFAAPDQLIGGSDLSGVKFDEVAVYALNVNNDGAADLAFVQKSGGGSKVLWLKSIEKTDTTGPRMVAGSALTDADLTWSSVFGLY